LLDGFKELHSKNVLHRDFKTDNIFMNDGICKIGDFGFSK
jgi:serine/threonine protein kinase